MGIVNDNLRLIIKNFFNKNGNYIIFGINNLIGRINRWTDESFEGEIFDNPNIDYSEEFWNEFDENDNSSFGYNNAEEAFDWIENESKRYLKYFKQ